MYYRSLDWVERAQEKRLVGVQAEAAFLMELPDPGERAEEAWRYSQTGIDLEKQGQKDQAMEAYGKSIAVYETLRVDFPAVPAYRSKLVDLLNKTGREKDVERVDGEAISRLEKLAAAHPKMALYQAELCNCYLSLAEASQKLGRLAEAKTALDQAIAIFEKLAAASPDLPEALQSVASAYRRLGDTLAALEQPHDADKAYDQALRLWQQLAKEHAEAPEHSMTLGYFFWFRAKRFAANNRLREAADAWRSAADVFGTLAEKYPNEPFYQQEQGYSYQWLGLLLREGDPPQAEKSLRQALDVHQKLVTDFANTVGAAQYRARLNWSRGELIANLMGQGKALAAGDQALVREAIEHCPENAEAQNSLAWNLVRFAGPCGCDPAEVVGLAEKAVAQAPNVVYIVNTLGVAQYRARAWKDAIGTLMRADDLGGGRSFSHNAFFIAMAHWELGQKEQARKWYTPALVWMEKHAPTNAELIDFRAEAASLLGLPEKLTAEQEQAKADDLKFYTLVVDAEPKASWTFAARASAYAEREQWQEAAADFAKAAELKADHSFHKYCEALIRIQVGDIAAYRRICDEMLERFAQETNIDSVQWTVWTCVLDADALDDWNVPRQLAEKAVAANPKTYRSLNHYGAVLYRAGLYQKAIDRLTEAEAASQADGQIPTAIAYNWLFLAMANSHLGRGDEAKKWHDKAVQWIDQEMQKVPTEHSAANPLPWNRRLTLQLLRSEAEELFQEESPSMHPEPNKDPADH